MRGKVRFFLLLLASLLLSGSVLCSGEEKKSVGKRENLALHCSVFSYTGRNPEYAVDGKRQGTFFESRWSEKNFLEIDLGEVRKADGVRIFFWHGDLRYYQFYVLSSVDGKKWEMLYDERKNSVRSREEGFGKDFPAIEMRFVRVFVLFNSVNASCHIREVEIYGKK